jgi:hypothetical protein
MKRQILSAPQAISVNHRSKNSYLAWQGQGGKRFPKGGAFTVAHKNFFQIWRVIYKDSFDKENGAKFTTLGYRTGASPFT